MVSEIDKEIFKDGFHQDEDLQVKLHRLFANSNGRIRKHDSIEMGFELSLAERDELIEYVKALKILAIYLSGRRNIRPENLSDDYFIKAERNFPEYRRREMDVGIQE